MPLDMSFRPQTFDADRRTVEAVIATDAPVSRRDARGAFLESLDLDTLEMEGITGRPVLDSHRQDSVRHTIGRVEKVWREGSKIIATIKLSAADDVTPIVQRIADGTLTGVSIGYRVPSWREAQEGGQRVKRPVRWSITEVTLTSNPADPSARLRQETSMPETDTQDTNDTQTRQIEADQERQRRTEIRSLCRSAGLPDETADQLIDAGADLTRAKAEIFDAVNTRRAAAPIIRATTPANDDPAEITRRQTDALAFRMGGLDKPTDESRQFLNMTLRDMASDSLARAGISTRGMSADEVFTRAGNHTTSDFSLVVSNAANKTALASYEAAQSPLKALCRQRTLPDFKEAQSIRLGELGRLEELGETGEIKHTSRAEGGEKMRLKTHASALTLSRQLLINDDLNMFGDVTRAFGEAAAQTEADILVDLLISNPDMADGTPVFDASRGNVHDTADPFNSETERTACLTASRRAMRNRKGLDGKTLINVMPKFLLVGPNVEGTAEQSLADIYPATSADVNPMAGKLTLLVEPRITDNRGYVFADPARLAALQFAYLSSAQGVQVQRAEAWDTLGMKFRAFLDFGAGWLDWRPVQLLPAS